MADPINDIVTVTITPATVNPTRLGFGTILVHTYHTRFPERIRRYEDISDMSADGFLSTDEAYRIAAKIKAQNPAVVQFAVGRKETAPSHTLALTMQSAVQGQQIKLVVLATGTGSLADPSVTGGAYRNPGSTQNLAYPIAVSQGQELEVVYTIPGSATTTTVATNVELLLEAIPGVSSTSSTNVITVTPTVAGNRVLVYGLVNATVEDTTPDAGYLEDLVSLQLEDDDWYFTTIDSSSSANILDVADWAESSERPKMFFAETSNTDGTSLASATAIGAALKADGLTRTATQFAFDPDDHIAGAYTGMGAPESPGSITWNNQILAGVTARPLTTSQVNALKAANMNYFITVRGQNIMRGGIVASGEHIDVIHGLDALRADIQESVLAVLIGKNKVPFTKAGFTVIEGAIRGALKRFEPADENAGGALLVYQSSGVQMPNIDLVNPADKAARRLRGVKFTAQLAGAIEAVDVVGTVSL